MKMPPMRKTAEKPSTVPFAGHLPYVCMWICIMAGMDMDSIPGTWVPVGALMVSVLAFVHGCRVRPSFRPGVDRLETVGDGFHPPPEMLLEIGNKGGVPPAELEVRGVHCRADLYVGERLVKAVSAGEFASGRVHVAVYAPGRIGGLDRNCLLLLHWARMSKRRHGFTMVPLFPNGRRRRRGLAFRLRERRYHRLFHGESVDGPAYGDDPLDGRGDRLL